MSIVQSDEIAHILEIREIIVNNKDKNVCVAMQNKSIMNFTSDCIKSKKLNEKMRAVLN